MARLIFRPERKETYLSRMNPLSKLIALIILSVLASLTESLIPVAIFFLLLNLIALSASIPLIKRLLSASSIMLLALLILITGYLSSSDAQSAWAEALRFISLFSLAIIFTGSTDMIDLSSSLGKALRPIAGRKAYALSSNVMLVFALLPDIFASAEEMLNARRARGGRFIAHPVRNISEYTVSLMKRLIARSFAFSEALDARAYSSERERSAPAFTFKDGMLIAAIALSGAIWINMI